MRFFTRDSLSRAARRSAVAVAAVALVGAGMATPSFAGLFTNDTINDMNDNDWENVYHYTGPTTVAQAGSQAQLDADYQNVNNYALGPASSSGTIGVGDYLLAIVQFDKVTTVNNQVIGNPPPGQLTAVSLLQVSGTSAGSGGNDVFQFTSASTDAWKALVGPNGQAGLIGSVYENDALKPFNPGTGSGNGLSQVSTATSGNLLWNFGFTGASNGSNGSDNQVSAKGSIGEGWRAVAPANPNTSGNGNFYGALSLLTPNAPGAPELNTVDKAGNGFDTAGNPQPGQFDSSGNYTFPNAGLRTDLQVNGTITTYSKPNGTDFGVTSTGDYFINVAPEPSSLLLMGLGFASFAGARLRRRKTNVAA